MMGYKIDCGNCALKYNPNNHYKCPFCGSKQESNKISSSSYSEINQPNSKRKVGPFGWYLFIFVLSAIIGGLLTLNEGPDSPNPNSGYLDEWNADNSIDGPNGTFDGQSKP